MAQNLDKQVFFLNEFYLTYKAVTDAGYNVDFATPNRIKATIDNESY